MKKYNIFIVKILSIIFLSNICVVLSAQKGLTTNDEAVYQKIEKEYTLNKDGSSSYRFYKKMTINTFNAMNRYYGETFILYNSQFQTLTINRCNTILPNGKVVKNTDNAFNEVLPGFCAKAPAYNFLKEMVVTHIGLELGATIELEYTIQTKAGFTNFFYDKVVFGEEIPIEEYVVTVHVPEGTKMGHGMNISICQEPEKQTADGMDTYQWQAKDLSPMPRGKAIPTVAETTPILVFTTARDFQRLFFDLVKQKCFENLTVPSAKNVIRDIQSKNNLEIAQITEIQKYVIENIKLVNIPDELLGYQFADAETIWQRKYATKAEKAILMAAMMHDAGIHAMPGYVCDRALYDVKVACPKLFENWVVKIYSNGKPLYISTTHSDKNNLKFYHLANKIVWGLDATAETLRSDLFEIQQPTVQLNCSLRIESPDKMVGNITLRTESEFQPYFAAANNENMTKNQINHIPEKSIQQIKEKIMTENQGEYLIQVEQTNFLTKKGDYYFWELPSSKAIDQAFNFGSLPIQRDAKLMAHPFRYNLHINLVIPEDMELITPIISKYSRKSFGNYNIEISVNENVIIIDRVLEISETEPIILPMHYDVFRTFYNEWNDAAYKQLIFNKK